jgi:hypothetical protein
LRIATTPVFIMLERYGFYVLAFGAVLALAAFTWLVVRAFRVSRLWGVGLILVPPLGLLFVVCHFARARAPAFLLGVAALVIAAPYAASWYERNYVPLAEYEQIVDGERRVTFTGIKGFDYGSYRWPADLGVVQMANADVTDATLDHLNKLPRLRYLDVSDTKITDAGLAKIAALPALVELRLARTAITDAGFQEHLAKQESILKLDLTGTEVKGKTKRDWKAAKPDVREYVD